MRAVRAARELMDVMWTAPRVRREKQGMREGLVADVRFAWRSLARSRGFLAAALTTLGAGMALCVTVMALVNAYLVRGLPYPESDRLYSVRIGQVGGRFLQGLDKLDWASLNDAIELPIAWDLDFFTLRGAPYTEGAQGTWVTTGYMAGFGVRPQIGRAFEPADFTAGAPQVALISHRMWQTRFGGSPDVLGRPVEAFVNDRPNEPLAFTIVGVLPRDHWHLQAFTEFMAPLRAPSYPYMVRLRHGVDAATAAERITALIRTGHPGVPPDWKVGLDSTHADYVRQIRPLLTAMAAATALVMLIACANVAVLFTVRATDRRREIAVRKALGASSGRIARALAAEAVLIGAVSTAIGLAVAHAALRAGAPLLERLIGRTVPGGTALLQIDLAIVGGALVTGLFVTAVCGAAQLWTSSKAPLSLALTGGQKGPSAGPQQRRAHASLIALEIGASLALLVGAALTIESGLRILRVNMGLTTTDVVVSRLNLRQQTYPDAATRKAFFDRFTAQYQSVSGIRQIAFANAWPLQAPQARDVGRDGEATFPARAGVTAVSDGYFDTLQVRIEDGRAFTAQDVIASERVTIVSHTLAARLWPNARAVGQRLRLAPAQAATPGQPPAVLTVIGVAADVRDSHTDQELADAYMSLNQYPSPAAFTYVRAPGATGRVEHDLRKALGQVDPELALVAPRLLSEILEQQRTAPRFLAWVLVVFASLAGALALIGIYGVIAYTVRQREQEIAVRVAIGADRATIVRLFLRQGAMVIGSGLALGVAGSILLGRVLQAQLFGVSAADPKAIAMAALGFGICGLLAAAWPARAAATLDPAAALKDS